jgi:hypothetical protein
MLDMANALGEHARREIKAAIRLGREQLGCDMMAIGGSLPPTGTGAMVFLEILRGGEVDVVYAEGV